MARYFSATILLERPWPIDVDRLAGALAERYPQIGVIEPVPGQSEARDAGIITIDNSNVVIVSEDMPVPEGELQPPLKTVRSWNPAPAIRTHRARLTVTNGGRIPGVDGAKAYAAAVQFTVAAALSVVPGRAVLWPASWTVTAPDEFVAGADAILEGQMPLGAWVGFAAVVPKGYAAADATGMVTYGLAPFIGRELELAPAPGDAMAAWNCLSTVTRQVLERGLVLADGQRIECPDRCFSLTVRERTYWLRRDSSALVLVRDDAVVDAETLQPRRAPAA